MKPIQTGPQSLRRFLCVTAVVAGLAVGGALTGCGSSRSSLSAGHSPAVLHLGAGGGRGMAAGAVADSKMMQIRPTSYVFDGTAPDLGTAAQAYTVGGQAGSAALVEQYAKAFGLTGTARELAADSGGGWQVGAADYTAPVLTAGQWGMHQWTYSTPMSATAGVSCTVATPPDGAASGTIPPEKCGEPTPAPNLPTEAEAISAAKRLLTAMGSDVAGYTFTTYPSAWNVTVNGTLTVGGLTTDLNVSFTFGANNEVQYAGGTLGTVTPLDSYPIVSVADGLKRLADPTGPWWSFGGPVAMARAAVDVAVDPAAGTITIGDAPTIGAPKGPIDTPTSAPIPMPSGTLPIDVPPVSVSVGSLPSESLVPDTRPTDTTPIDTTPFVVHLNGAKLVLSSVWQADGTQLLLPAFDFTSSDGGEYGVLAVDATYLDTTSTATTGTAVTAVSGSAVSGSGSSGSGGGSIAVPTPALGTIVLANFDDAKQLAGLPLDKATDLAKAKGWEIRVAEEDGVTNTLTADLVPNRVNVIVKDGVVFDIMSVG